MVFINPKVESESKIESKSFVDCFKSLSSESAIASARSDQNVHELVVSTLKALGCEEATPSIKLLDGRDVKLKNLDLNAKIEFTKFAKKYLGEGVIKDGEYNQLNQNIQDALESTCKNPPNLIKNPTAAFKARQLVQDYQELSERLAILSPNLGKQITSADSSSRPVVPPELEMIKNHLSAKIEKQQQTAKIHLKKFDGLKHPKMAMAAVAVGTLAFIFGLATGGLGFVLLGLLALVPGGYYTINRSVAKSYVSRTTAPPEGVNTSPIILINKYMSQSKALTPEFLNYINEKKVNLAKLSEVSACDPSNEKTDLFLFGMRFDHDEPLDFILDSYTKTQNYLAELKQIEESKKTTKKEKLVVRESEIKSELAKQEREMQEYLINNPDFKQN